MAATIPSLACRLGNAQAARQPSESAPPSPLLTGVKAAVPQRAAIVL